MKRHMLAAGLCLGVAAYAMGLTIFGPAVTAMAAGFGTDEAAVGTLFMWMAAGFLLSTAAGWALSGRIGLKWFAAPGISVLAIGLIMVGTGGTYPTAAAGMALYGVGGAFLQIATNAGMADLYPRRQAFALNVLHSSFGISALLGPRFSGYWIASGHEWKEVYIMAGVAAFLPLPFYLLLRFPDHSRGTGRQNVGQVSDRLHSPWTDPVVVLTALAIFFYVGAEVATNNWSVRFLEASRSFDSITAAAALSNFWLALTIGRLAVIGLAARISPERLLLLLATSSVLSGMLLLLGPDSLAGTAMVALGASYSGIFATLFAVATTRMPGAAAPVSAMLTFAAGVGILVLTPAVGYVARWVGHPAGFGLTVVYLGALLGCTIVITRKISRERR